MGLELVRGVLLDIDGVLATSWRALPGAIGTIAWIREHEIPFRLITNTTTHTRSDLAVTLGEAGFDVEPTEIITAVVATASYLRNHHPEARVYVLSDGEGSGDLQGVELVEEPSDADVIAIGGACDDFSYATVNRVFRRLSGGAVLVGMHRNMYWKTAGGLELDAGAYIAGLEAATGTTSVICGKPSKAYFEAALEPLVVPANEAIMVGDDIENDVVGAQAAGLTGVLVRTGKFRPTDLERGTPDHVIDSIADLPGLLRG
ncbi:MAG TPA: TIGR01458 family HAD-type hydrolase [Actinomycetota bacterium]